MGKLCFLEGLGVPIRFLDAALALLLLGPAVAAADDREIAATSRPADEVAGAYKLSPGPYRVRTVDLELHDAKRDKSLPLKIRYPTDATGTLPVIVFSHGMGGSNDAFPELTQHWAGHGYVVLLPTHADSIKLRRQRGEDAPRSLKEFKDRREVRKVDPVGRRDDLAFIVDSLALIAERVPALRNAAGASRLDAARLGVSGHSAGAYTTQLAIGVKARTVRSGGRLAAIGDERFKAAILISGQGLSSRAFARDSWDELSKPLLVITGSRDTSAVSDETPASRQHPYEYAKAGDKYLLFLEGATHSSYSGRNMARLLGEGRVENVRVITDAMAAQTLAFWDAYLLGNASAREYLIGDHVRKMHKIVRAEHK